jgi:hypothetical protein
MEHSGNIPCEPRAASLPHDDHCSDFDFQQGSWRVQHRRLKARLAGCTEWETFTGTSEQRPLLGGNGNIEDNLLLLPDGDYRAVALRSFDPAWHLGDLVARRPQPARDRRSGNWPLRSRHRQLPCRRHARRPPRPHALPVAGYRHGQAALGTGAVGGWRGELGDELGDGVWAGIIAE